MIYDHERDVDSRRGRQVADWGGDELFSSMPRRRSKYAGARPRRFSGPATGSHGVHHAGTGDQSHAAVTGSAAVAVPAPAPGSVATVTTADAAHPASARSHAGHRGPGRRGHDRAALPREPLAPAEPSTPPAATPVATSGSEEVRRTVAVKGRPDRLGFAPPRHRPRPTLQERYLAGRPDKIAGWAVGLGITLSLIALGTADGSII